jgi:hypothetical protein
MPAILAQNGNILGILSLVLSALPWLYFRARLLPDSAFTRTLCGPLAILAGAVLAGAAASRGSKWWMLALVGPFLALLLLPPAGG